MARKILTELLQQLQCGKMIYDRIRYLTKNESVVPDALAIGKQEACATIKIYFPAGS